MPEMCLWQLEAVCCIVQLSLLSILPLVSLGTSLRFRVLKCCPAGTHTRQTDRHSRELVLCQLVDPNRCSTKH